MPALQNVTVVLRVDALVDGTTPIADAQLDQVEPGLVSLTNNGASPTNFGRISLGQLLEALANVLGWDASAVAIARIAVDDATATVARARVVVTPPSLASQPLTPLSEWDPATEFGGGQLLLNPAQELSIETDGTGPQLLYLDLVAGMPNDFVAAATSTNGQLPNYIGPSATPVSLTAQGANLILTTLSNGDLVLSPDGDLSAVADTVNIQSPGLAVFGSTAGTTNIASSGGPANVIASGNATVQSTSGAARLTAGGTTHEVTSSGDVESTLASGAAMHVRLDGALSRLNVDGNTNAQPVTEQLVQLSNAAVASVGLYVSNASPNGVIDATPGSLCILQDGATSRLFQNTSAAPSGTTWTAV